MIDLRNAQIAVRKIEAEFCKNFNSIKWNEIYQSEDEIVEDLKQIHIPKKEDLYKIGGLYKGYEYIHSFAKQVQSGKTLSDKQMTQCKKLAFEIKKAVTIKDFL